MASPRRAPYSPRHPEGVGRRASHYHLKNNEYSKRTSDAELHEIKFNNKLIYLSKLSEINHMLPLVNTLHFHSYQKGKCMSKCMHISAT